MQKFINLLLGAAVIALAVVVFAQRGSKSATDATAVDGELSATSPDVAPATASIRRASPAPADVARRLEQLEHAIQELTRATESLMERGELALSSNKLDELQRRFLDAGSTDKERLQALRLLRRNKGLSDEVVLGALAWVQSATDSQVRRDLLQQLDGLTNASVRQSLLALATTDADPRVRREAVENLRRIAGDGEVEARLWEIASRDPDPKVREQAQDALREGPMTPGRVARFQQQASNPQGTIDDRLHAMRALVSAGADVSGPAASLAMLAQNAPDPDTRAKIFRAFDGGRDPAMLSPLVGGLQDADPAVRKAAADSLSGFGADPRVRQWLEFVAQSDTDTRVRREAQQVLKELQKPR